MARLVATGLAVWLLTLAGLSDAAQGTKDKPEPKGGLVLMLVPKKTTDPLDLGGKTPAEYRKELEKAESVRNGSPVEVELVIRNTGDKAERFPLDGDTTQIGFVLKGPGALTRNSGLAFTADFRMPSKFVTL